MNDIIQKAKSQEEEKVAISLKVPVHTKTKLQTIADENSISLNSLCVSILENALDGSIDKQSTLNLLEELDKAKKAFQQACSMLEIGKSEISEKGVYIDFEVEKMIAQAKIAGITSELNRRS